MDKSAHETNRLSWNEATKAHNRHKGDQAEFFRNGGNKLRTEDLELLGDVNGKTVIHLQCNSGQDTLSIARLGVQITGVDISDEAINFARQLSTNSGIPATFIRSDLYDWFEQAQRDQAQFDLAYTSYGVLMWLSDLTAWGAGIASILKPGGKLIVIDFHPYALCMKDWRPYHAYMGGQRTYFEQGVSDYVANAGDAPELGIKIDPDAPQFENPNPDYEFAWGIGDILTALIEAGLTITHFHEYPYSNGFKPFGDMREAPGRRYYPPEGIPNIPLMFSIMARRPA